MIKALEGHTFAEVSKRKAGKLFADTPFLEKAVAALENGGRVYATREKKNLVCCYIFERARMQEDGREIWVYKLTEKFWKPEKIHLMEIFERTILKQLKEYVMLDMAKAVIWGEDVYILKKNTEKDYRIAAVAIGILFGISCGALLDDWLYGVSMAVMWASILNLAFQSDKNMLVKREK